MVGFVIGQIQAFLAGVRGRDPSWPTSELGKDRTLRNLSSGPLRGLKTEHKWKGMIDRLMRIQLRGERC